MSNQGAGQPQTRSRRLVLHFDIGNTIVMKDNSKDIKSVQLNVSLQFLKQNNVVTYSIFIQVARIISKSAWGEVTPPVESDEKQLPNWKL